MSHPNSLEKIKNMAKTAEARITARQAVVDGRKQAAKVKQMINKPRPRVAQ